MYKKTFFLLISLATLFSSCENPQPNNAHESEINFINKGHEKVYNMAQKVGDYNKLWNKNNVSYTYTYETPDGKKDIVSEKYIFDGELSYGAYEQHERTFPQLKGLFEQGYDGKNFWLKHQGKLLEDTNLLNRVAFNRPTNYYWFTMMQKLLDSGLIYEHLGTKTLDSNTYDIVKVTFETKNEKPTDIYQLYINQETNLVDQFLFTVADFGKMETPYLMQLEYEEIDGLLIPSIRQYKASTWDATVSNEPWIKVRWTNIQFNNDFTSDFFKKENQASHQ